MLPHYSPLKVAETFGLLAGLYPDRVDLAVGRAAGTDPLTAFALQRDRRQTGPDDFPDQLTELVAYLTDGFPAGHRFAQTASVFRGAPRPAVWLLGSSPQSAIWAAQFGLPYAFADFISPTGATAARGYRAAFVPRAGSTPYVIVAVWALVAETTEEAQHLASSAQVAFLRFLGGDPLPIPSVEVARVVLEQHPEALQVFSRHRRAVIGSPAEVRRAIEIIAAEYCADEIMVVTMTHDHEARKRSYQLLAGEFTTPA
jgi:luciferase family oxidoreductase group 1